MNAMKYVQETFQKEFKGVKEGDINYNTLKRERLIEFRKQKNSIERITKPTNLARARTLGYKAKQGIIVVRVKLRRGSGMHTRPIAGRRPKRMGTNKKTREKSIQRIAEERASKKYKNMEVLNSYWIGQDGKTQYYEVILVEPANPSIIKDKDLSWITTGKHSGRAERGKTSAGKKGRGLRNKGKGSEKARPSQKAKGNKLK